MFNRTEQKAIEEKIEQLEKVKEGILTVKELAELIMQRRITWFEENKDAILSKYADLSDEEKAYRTIFFDHMKIDPEHSKMKKVGSTKIKIESYNFCPYLEACKQLGLDTKFVCKEICEQSIQKVSEMINPKIKFSRNYQKIRPYNYFCEEYFEIS
jgi:hypothetical protein